MTPLVLPQTYSQFDDRWAAKILGFNTDPKFDFKNYACLITEQCDVLEFFGIHMTPDQWNDILKENAGFVNGGFYVPGTLPRIYPAITEKNVKTPDPLTDEQMQEIKTALDSGCPVVLGIDYNPKTLLVDYHFVTAIAYNSNDENDFTIADSLGGRVHSLKDYLGSMDPSARITINQYFIYTKVGEAVTPTPPAAAAQTVTPSQPSTVSALPENYPAIVHGSTQWDTTVKTYRPDLSPESADFATIKQTIDAQVKTVEKIVEKDIPVAASTPDHAASEWDQTVTYLELGKSPQDASFDDVKRVIAGIKSRQTDFERQAKNAQVDSAKKDTTITNLNEEVSKLGKDLLQKDKLQRIQIESLKQSQPSFDKLVRQYEAVLKEKEGDLRAKIDEVKKLRIDLTEKNVEKVVDAVKQAEQKIESNPALSGRFGQILSFLGRLIKLNW